jgi:hypothetical protein
MTVHPEHKKPTMYFAGFFNDNTYFSSMVRNAFDTLIHSDLLQKNHFVNIKI